MNINYTGWSGSWYYINGVNVGFIRPVKGGLHELWLFATDVRSTETFTISDPMTFEEAKRYLEVRVRLEKS